MLFRSNHFVGLHTDLRAGMANLALISMRESELLRLVNLPGYSPNLTIRDYEVQFRRTAEFLSRAIFAAAGGLNDEDYYYPFITIMIPVVMMGDWIGTRDDMIHAFLREVAPGIRESIRESGRHEALVEEVAATRAT